MLVQNGEEIAPLIAAQVGLIVCRWLTIVQLARASATYFRSRTRKYLHVLHDIETLLRCYHECKHQFRALLARCGAGRAEAVGAVDASVTESSRLITHTQLPQGARRQLVG